MAETEAAWDDLRTFLSVARLGGLRAAARATAVSAATLGRRMAVLERDVGRPLFRRSVNGYALTRAGEELLSRAEEVEAAIRGFVRWRDGGAGDRIVRLSAGPWVSEFFGSHIGDLWKVDDRIQVEIVTALMDLDVSRRVVDLDIRRERSSVPGTAQRRIGTLAYAVYSGRKRINGVEAGYFVGFGGEMADQPLARWLEAHHGDRIGVRCNDVHTVLQLVAGGAGLSIFPCFVGDADERLVRLGKTIAELTNELWLVSHGEGRHDTAVRKVSDRIALLMRRNRPLFAGDRGRRSHRSAPE